MKKKIILVLIIVIIISFVYYILYPPLRIHFNRSKLKKLNIILITIDTLRASHVSAYGLGKAYTPNMDKLASEGVLFKRCISQTPLTLPSHTTILSGTYPLYHKVRDNGGFIVPKKLKLVSERLKEKGFKTGAFIAAYVLHSKWGLNQGFDIYQDSFDMTKYKVISLGKIQKRADQVLKEAESWIIKNQNKQFFAWIHLYDPHTPYDPPSPFKEKCMGHPYRGEVEYTDYELGLFFNFLKRRGLYGKTLIILTADHGESLGQHHEKTHGFFIYQPTVWVPLIIRAPFSFSKKKINSLVELVDITPTILDVVGIKKDKLLQGRSLLNLMFAKKDGKKFNIAYTETYYPRFHYGWSELKAIYYNNYKYVLAPKDELYKIDEDGREKRNLSLYKKRLKKKLKKILENFIKEKSLNSLSVIHKKNLSKEEIKKLSALGYISTFVNTENKKILADPKDKVSIYNKLLKVKRLMAKKEYEQAIELVKEIIKNDKEIVDAYMVLGNLYYREKEFNKAMDSFYNVLKRKPDYNFAMINIVNCLIASMRFDEAEREIKKFLKKFPKDYTLYSELAKIYLLGNDYDKALKNFLKSLKFNPTNAEAMNKIGEIYIIKNQFDKADNFLKKAVKIAPTMKEVYYNMAQIKEKQKEYEEAINYYKKELENNPENFKATYNMAEDLRESGNTKEAIKYYEKTISINPKFNIPYFMIAKYLLNKKENLERAIALCKKGVQIKPFNKYTVLGYYILSDIYSLKGDKNMSDMYYIKGKRMMMKIKE